jgi:hypothetical protein
MTDMQSAKSIKTSYLFPGIFPDQLFICSYIEKVGALQIALPC